MQSRENKVVEGGGKGREMRRGWGFWQCVTETRQNDVLRVIQWVRYTYGATGRTKSADNL